MTVPGVSPHTLYTVGPALLKLLGDLARTKHLPACLHLAESAAEMEFLSSGGGDIAKRLYPAVGKDVSWDDLQKNYDGVIFANTTGNLAYPFTNSVSKRSMPSSCTS